MITLKPILDKKEYSSMIEVVIMDFLIDNFYKPIYEVIEPIEEYYNEVNNKSKQVNNDTEMIIIAALLLWKIQYINGKFKGQFTAKISKALESIGAKFNKVTKTYNIHSTALSIPVKEAIASTAMVAMMRQKLLLEALAVMDIEKAMPDLVRVLQVPLDTILEDLDEQAYLSLKDAITIVPEITPEQREALKAQYVDDVSLSVKNFTKAQTDKLRAMVEENLFTGLADNKSLVQAIVDEFNVTESKARFLSRQETSLFTAKYRKITYMESGITKYRWSTAGDEKVRPYHRDLNNQIISWDNPPVVNEQGEHKHAGEDWNCRCVSVPVIDETLLPNQ